MVNAKSKQEFAEDESCEGLRNRGNQAFKAGDASEAENLYTEAIDRGNKTLSDCFSKRATVRESLGRKREAINDLKCSIALDLSLLSEKYRVAECYLLLGEVETAIQYYQRCIKSGEGVCLDRGIVIKASNGLQKAEKVGESSHRSAELLKQQTCDAARSALEIIDDALSISRYSEKLLEMKGECLCKLQKYDEAIKLCEETLDFAENNFANDSVRLWRCYIMSKSYYHLGKLEEALDLIKKQKQVISVNDGSGSKSQESLIPLETTIRELLAHRKAGNKAFQSGKFAEALDHYNAAISKSVESQRFAAICFCNRAAAHQGLGQIIDAIADCSVSMALDENYAKATSRRATLYEMIRDYVDAATDLERLISLLENEAQGSSSKELRKARERLSSVEEKAKSGIPLDLYLILGTKSSDDESVIKKAYKKAALNHSDKVTQLLKRSVRLNDRQLWKDICEKVKKDADNLFKMIGTAYDVLSDTAKRKEYNLEEETRGE